jgi:hypothetical protein
MFLIGLVIFIVVAALISQNREAPVAEEVEIVEEEGIDEEALRNDVPEFEVEPIAEEIINNDTPEFADEPVDESIKLDDVPEF